MCRLSDRCSASRDAIAASICPASWQKIADRYWLPKSRPWRLRVVGLWICQNVWSSCA